MEPVTASLPMGSTRCLPPEAIESRWISALSDVADKPSVGLGSVGRVGECLNPRNTTEGCRARWPHRIAECYYNGATSGSPNNIRSAGKSITALLAGIAIDQGSG